MEQTRLYTHRRLAVAVAAALAAPQIASAAAWTSSTGGSWNDAKWNTASTFWADPDFANFGVNMTATTDETGTVSLDGSRTLKETSGNQVLTFGSLGTNTRRTRIVTGTGGSLTLQGNSASASPLITVNSSTADASLRNIATIDAVLAGSNGFTKVGAGTLILNNLNNTISGAAMNNGAASSGVRLSLGRLIIAGDGSLGAKPASMVGVVTAGANVGPGSIDFVGGTTYNATSLGTADAQAAAPTTITLGQSRVTRFSATNSAFFSPGANSTLKLEGIMVSSASGGTIGSVNAGGTLEIAGGISLGIQSDSSPKALTFTGPGNIVLSSSIGRLHTTLTTINGLSTNWAASPTAITGNNSATLGANDRPVLLNSVYDDTLTVADTFTGTLTLKEQNLHRGATTVKSGTVLLQADSLVAPVEMTITGSAGNSFTVTGGVPASVKVGTLITGTGISGSPSITSISGSTIYLDENLAAQTNKVVNANIGGALGAGSASVVLGNSAVSNTSASILIDGNYTVAKNISVVTGSSGTLALGQNAAAGGTFSGGITLANNLTLKAKAGGAANFTGNITGTGNVTIGDATNGFTGTVKLNGTNSFSGTTTLTAGKLSGGGSVSGAVNITGGTLAAGNSVGTLTVGGLTLGAASALEVEFNSSANDIVIVTGSNGLTINGGAVSLFAENTTALANLAAGSYHLFEYAGSLGGSLANLSVANDNTTDSTTYAFGTSIAGGKQYVDLVVTVPEPGMIGLIGMGLAALAGRRRRSA